MTDFLDHIVSSLQPNLQLALIIIFAIALITMIIAGVMIMRHRKKSRQNRDAKKKAALRSNNTLSGYMGDVHKASSRLVDLFKRAKKNAKPETPRDTVAASFDTVIETLKGYFGPKNAAYKLPWYLVLGPEGSGKTSLLAGANLELPIGALKEGIGAEDAALSWSFYDQAVVAEVRGDVLLDAENQSDDSMWDYILNLLKFNRPKRPLDGIILALSAEELQDVRGPSKDRISQRGRAIYSKLWKLQNTLGMRVPVYTVVTKSDKIPGFADLIHQVPAEKRQEIFGWSSPFDIKAAFSDAWIKEIFQTLRRSLNKVRSGVFTRDIDARYEPGNVLLPIEISKMRETLGHYINAIFHESAYHDSFFLRGVYFVGSEGTPGYLPHADDAAKANDAQPKAPSSASPMPLVFVQDLFLKKIFPEHNLGEPNTRLLVSTNKMLNTLKVIGGVFGVIWVVGMISASRDLDRLNKNLIPSLRLIDDTIIGANEQIATGDLKKFQRYLNTKATEVLREFISIASVNTFSIYLPASWFSAIDDRVQLSFTAAYDRIILPSLRGAFLERADAIIGHDQGLQITPEHKVSHPNPLDTLSFMRLERYVREVTELEKQVAEYNRLETTTSLDALGRMIKYLFNAQLPAQFYNNSDYYRHALSKVVDRDLDLSGFEDPAKEKLRNLYRTFLLHAFNVNENLPMVVALKDDLDAIAQYSAYKRMDEKDLRKVTEKAISVADLAISGRLAWLSKKIFDPGQRYRRVMNNIASANLMGQGVSNDLTRVADQAFAKYRLSIAQLQTPLLGPIFKIINGQLTASPSEGLVTFIDSASAFLGQGFMSPTDAYQLNTVVPPGRLLFWDEPALGSADGVVKKFDDFVSQQLSSFPTKYQNVFREIGRNAVRKKVINFTVTAQTFEQLPVNANSFTTKELLSKQVSNVATVTPIFERILGVFNDGAVVLDAVNIRELLINQSYGILKRIDQLLQDEHLYSSNQEELIYWYGNPQIAFKLFAVRDSNELRDYLTAQRHYIQYMANELAKPIIVMLTQSYLTRSPRSMPLIGRWHKIIQTLEAYDKKTPGNSLQVLENFLLEDLNKISLENCLKKIGDFGDTYHTSDYFMDIRNYYYNLVEKRCEEIGLARAIELFNNAASFFNANLAGRFPFTKNPDDQALPEALADDVRVFFELFDRLNDEFINILKHKGQSVPLRRPILNFIQDIESVRPLMMASVDTENGKRTPRILLSANFLTDREREQGGQDIIDWNVNIAGQVMPMGRETSVEWRVGLPISVDIKWAQNGAYYPAPDERLNFMTVSGPLASFDYGGRWALARLLREHVTDDTRFSADRGANSMLMEFAVPTTINRACHPELARQPRDQESAPARIYMRMAMTLPAESLLQHDAATKRDQDKQNGDKNFQAAKQKYLRLPLPQFPYRAPLYLKP